MNKSTANQLKDPRVITTIQELLQGRNADFDAAKNIKLVRHADNRPIKIINGQEVKDSLLNLYRFDNEKFLAYQSEQPQGKFDNTDFVVVFVGEGGTKSRFIAVYKVGAITPSPYNAGECLIDFIEMEDFKPLSRRIVIDWGKSTVSWHQNYRTQIKPVIRIDEGFEDANGIPRFTSYADTILSFDELKAIFTHNDDHWHNVLQAVNGIYLITDRSNGKQYVGSTYNAKGIWGRWEMYFQTGGHGNNVRLKEIIDNDPNYVKNFQWTILEHLPISISDEEAISRESLYKRKFMTRQHGYNDN